MLEGVPGQPAFKKGKQCPSNPPSHSQREGKIVKSPSTDVVRSTRPAVYRGLICPTPRRVVTAPAETTQRQTSGRSDSLASLAEDEFGAFDSGDGMVREDFILFSSQGFFNTSEASQPARSPSENDAKPYLGGDGCVGSTCKAPLFSLESRVVFNFGGTPSQAVLEVREQFSTSPKQLAISLVPADTIPGVDLGPQLPFGTFPSQATGSQVIISDQDQTVAAVSIATAAGEKDEPFEAND